MRGAGLADLWARALSSLNGSSLPPKLRLRPPRKLSADPFLPDRLARRRCASRSSSPSSMLRSVKKSGWAPRGTDFFCCIPRMELKGSVDSDLFERSRQLNLILPPMRDSQTLNRSLVVSVAPMPVVAELARLCVLTGSMNWELPLFMLTAGELELLLVTRWLTRPRSLLTL